MSAVDSQIHLPAIQVSHPPDVIDVDALDADDIVYVGSAARPSQRRRVAEDGRAVPVTREVIHVTDSEDDNEIQFVGHHPAHPRPPLVRRERIFSPPPPPQIDGIPPVPPIPHRFLPLRPRPSPGPIIPNQDPFPFEADLRPPMEQPAPAPAAAAPSHHVPSMGFGGAMIAGVRQRIIGPRNASYHERHNGWGVSGSFVLRWDPFDFPEGEEEILDELDDMGFLHAESHPFATRRVRTQIERVFKQRDQDNQLGPDYRPDYTHPERPSPGFTHDFSSSSSTSESGDSSASHRDSGSGSRLCEATIVCAACRDPLVLGASDVGKDRVKRKLWGLRCGHLLDGKCIEKLMEPVPPNSDTAGSSSANEVLASTDDIPSSSQDTVDVVSDAYSMRSRLRPRRTTGTSLVSSRSAPTPATSGGRRGAATRTQAAQRSSRKGKGKMKAPVVEAEHEWKCPASGCGHVHLSLFVDGRWTMDEKRGAIAVFV